MRPTLFFLLLVFTSIMVNSQGSWNIDYITIDSIKDSHIGQIARIDFKSSTNFQTKNLDVRSYLATQDTGIIAIDGRQVSFLEIRRIYVDHGSYNDQYLKSLHAEENEIQAIYDVKIIAVTSDSIQFEGYLRMRRISYEGQTPAVLKKFWISRKYLDGLITKLIK